MKKKNPLTHVDAQGRARMVDVSAKAVTQRFAVAEATLHMRPETLALIVNRSAPKGDVLGVARIAGIQAAKRTHELIPLCHQLPLSSVSIDFEFKKGGRLRIQSCAQCEARTGVEMEALIAANVAGLTVYDMLKAADRKMEMSGVRLLEKAGGRSGHWLRKKKGKTKRK